MKLYKQNLFYRSIKTFVSLSLSKGDLKRTVI